MIIAVPRESLAGERRVALVPGVVPALAKLGLQVHVQSGAGDAAGFPDREYEQKGATIVPDRDALLAAADLIATVRTAGADPNGLAADLPRMKSNQTVIGFAESLTSAEQIRAVAERGITLFAMELVPRTTRAQAVDALSSQANIAGFKAVILAADHLPKILPMMMTAAGTLQPAKVLVVGAGVAGLQAIATAKRLGAIVSGYDVRPAVKEQVQSLGAKFVELPLEGAEAAGGYAKELSAEQIRKQQELMAKVVAESDLVICTAAIPGKKAPTIVTRAMVEKMSPGSVVMDLAAERGGNCEVTQPGKTINHNGVTIIGETNVPAAVPNHASQMYANNLVALLKTLVKDGQVRLNTDDEIIAGMLVCRGGQIVHPRVREAMGLQPASHPEKARPMP